MRFDDEPSIRDRQAHQPMCKLARHFRVQVSLRLLKRDVGEARTPIRIRASRYAAGRSIEPKWVGDEAEFDQWQKVANATPHMGEARTAKEQPKANLLNLFDPQRCTDAKCRKRLVDGIH